MQSSTAWHCFETGTFALSSVATKPVSVVASQDIIILIKTKSSTRQMAAQTLEKYDC
jgi:hypothetical protein